MAKKTKVAVDAAVQQATVLVVPTGNGTVALYELGKLPRSGLNEGTKHGNGGTSGTYKAVCAALADGPKTIAELTAVTAANGDKGFARYAVRNHWLLPVQPK